MTDDELKLIEDAGNCARMIHQLRTTKELHIINAEYESASYLQQDILKYMVNLRAMLLKIKEIEP